MRELLVAHLQSRNFPQADFPGLSCPLVEMLPCSQNCADARMQWEWLNCSSLGAMAERPNPVFRTIEDVLLIGTMSVYDSQAEASQHIPHQWREFRLTHPALGSRSKFYGASPCTSDRKIHYLTGVAQESPESLIGGERLTLEAGEYAVVRVNDTALLRDTWIWLLKNWLPASGRREKHAPEFERFTGISEAGSPIGPVEIWIPLEPLATN
jgi:AraC family transcriptional regulator